MNRFAILYQFALFCISFTLARAGCKIYCKIKEASVDYGTSAQTFNNENVYLYEVTDELNLRLKYYKIGDESGEFSEEFLIDPHNTAVTVYKITVDWCTWRIILLLDGDTFAFYQDLLPQSLEGFSHEFPASAVFQGRNVCENITVMKAKETEIWNVWLLVALNGDKPRFIVPCVHLDYESSTISENDVTLVIESIEDKPTVISVAFDNSIDASAFYVFVMSTTSHKGRPPS